MQSADVALADALDDLSNLKYRQVQYYQAIWTSVMKKILKCGFRVIAKALTVDGDAFSASKEWPFLWAK